MASKLKAVCYNDPVPLALSSKYATHIYSVFPPKLPTGDVIMKVLHLHCMLNTWKNNTLIFVDLIQNYSFMKNIDFLQPHQMEFLSAIAVVMEALK